MTVEVQATLTRIKTHPGVLGTLIIDPDGTVLDHELQDKIKDNQQDLAAFIPALAAMASDLVRDLDPQDPSSFWLSFKNQISHSIDLRGENSLFFILDMLQPPQNGNMRAE